MLSASLYIRAHLVALLLTERLVKLGIQLNAFTFQDSTKQHFGIKRGFSTPLASKCCLVQFKIFIIVMKQSLEKFLSRYTFFHAVLPISS